MRYRDIIKDAIDRRTVIELRYKDVRAGCGRIFWAMWVTTSWH